MNTFSPACQNQEGEKQRSPNVAATNKIKNNSKRNLKGSMNNQDLIFATIAEVNSLTHDASARSLTPLTDVQEYLYFTDMGRRLEHDESVPDFKRTALEQKRIIDGFQRVSLTLERKKAEGHCYGMSQSTLLAAARRQSILKALGCSTPDSTGARDGTRKAEERTIAREQLDMYLYVHHSDQLTNEKVEELTELEKRRKFLPDADAIKALLQPDRDVKKNSNIRQKNRSDGDGGESSDHSQWPLPRQQLQPLSQPRLAAEAKWDHYDSMKERWKTVRFTVLQLDNGEGSDSCRGDGNIVGSNRSPAQDGSGLAQGSFLDKRFFDRTVSRAETRVSKSRHRAGFPEHIQA